MDVEELNNIINQLDLMRFTEHSTQLLHVQAHTKHLPRDYILGYKTIYNKFERSRTI